MKWNKFCGKRRPQSITFHSTIIVCIKRSILSSNAGMQPSRLTSGISDTDQVFLSRAILYIVQYRDQTCFSMHQHLLDPNGDVETRAWKARVLTTPRGLADVSVSENHVWSFCHYKTLEKLYEKLILVYYNGAQKHEGFVGFENACSRANTYVILTSLNYVHFYACLCWWRLLLWRPRMRTCKVQKSCINNTWIAWLIHGFLPV